jgi:GT2 family glycosyltransferase
VLSIIIVNYRSIQLILDCIHSICRETSDTDVEIIVVDNASGDNSEQLLKNNFPAARWIQMGYNAGFARANNAGMQHAKGNTYLLLNPDTIIEDRAIDRCYKQLLASSYIAAGVQMLNPDRSPQISGNFFMKGGLNHLLPIPYWGELLRQVAFSIKTKVPNVAVAKEIEEVDWISGAFLMVKKEYVDRCGMMDEDFFLYAEEVEWCSRLRKAGKLCIFGNIHIIHIQGEAINKDQKSTEKGYQGLFDKKALQVMVSNHVRIRKQYGVGWFFFQLINYSWGVLVYAVIGFFHRLFTFRNPFGDMKKVAAFARNVGSIWLLTPVIIRNKPHFYKML